MVKINFNKGVVHLAELSMGSFVFGYGAPYYVYSPDLRGLHHSFPSNPKLQGLLLLASPTSSVKPESNGAYSVLALLVKNPCHPHWIGHL